MTSRCLTPSRLLPGGVLAFSALLLLSAGCTSSSTEGPSAEKAEAAEPTKPFKLGDLIEPFDPPSLEEVDATANWQDRPVRDGLKVMRELLAEQGKPEITADEALKLRNDSPETNARMRAALGQLAPEDGSGVNYNASVTRHVGGDLKSTNPLSASSVTEFEYQSLTNSGILSFDKNFEWFATIETVKSWQTSEDKMVDKFVLRDDVFWSDGTPVTAHDYEFSFQATMTEAVVVPAVRSGVDELKWVKAYDDHTLVIFHKESLPTNTENMQISLIPKHVYEKTIPDDPTLARSKEHSRLEDDPVVSGPYKLVKRTRGQEFVLERREDYYMHDGEQVRDKPYFKTVRVNQIDDFNTALLALKSGDIDQMELRPEQWVTQTNGDDFYQRNTKVYDTEWVEFHFIWNVESTFFEDKNVRWAMTYAMDYEELLETICYGLYEQSRGNYHPDAWMFPKDGPEPVKQDLEKAQQLLAEAGWEDTDGDGILDKEINGRRRPFEFTLTTYTTETGIKTATLMKECLDLLGIVCNVKPTEFTVMQEKSRNHEFEAMMAGWGTGTDPFTNQNIFGTGEGRNYGNYSSERVDELFDQGKREFDSEKRAKIYADIHMQLWEDQPYTWLFYRSSFYGFNKKLRGYNFSPRGPFGYSPGFGSVWSPEATP
ncbi:Oligopeptide-binding protein AppA precursor [Posidoniimonas corsicana]|uniref:Oligopeptide-binding protein AppA n=1 Tax=Posidoniimonas corsicana TaxID=1938618 RepID=A0A5C5UW19_9BACT|nr:ABC transporter substrate-binding protein [Posidoniimonas corsicana]TWT30368.1 Oligopeptide-binding protein AppA precursor [Posidoniimonas corsicana]